MPVINGEEAEYKGILAAAELIAVAARTAPKARGLDSISTRVVTGDEREPIAKTMEEKAEAKGDLAQAFRRDANAVRRSPVLVLIGVKGTTPKNLNCGACGYQTCSEFNNAKKVQGPDFTGPLCIFQALDLGIALGSAAKIASDFNVDNRLMYTIGAATRKLGLMDADLVIALPLSSTGKSIFFDRR